MTQTIFLFILDDFSSFATLSSCHTAKHITARYVQRQTKEKSSTVLKYFMRVCLKFHRRVDDLFYVFYLYNAILDSFSFFIIYRRIFLKHLIKYHQLNVFHLFFSSSTVSNYIVNVCSLKSPTLDQYFKQKRENLMFDG